MTRGVASIAFRILAIVIAMAWAGVAYADKRVALVIGNSQYRSIPGLRTPANDAADIAKALQSIGFDVTLKNDVTIGDLPSVLADFARKSQGADTTLFYYAGHGIQYQGKNYILPVDITVQDADDVEFKAIESKRSRDGRDAPRWRRRQDRDSRSLAVTIPWRSRLATRSLNGGSSSTRPELARIDRTEGIVTVYSAECWIDRATTEPGATVRSPRRCSTTSSSQASRLRRCSNASRAKSTIRPIASNGPRSIMGCWTIII